MNSATLPWRDLPIRGDSPSALWRSRLLFKRPPAEENTGADELPPERPRRNLRGALRYAKPPRRRGPLLLLLLLLAMAALLLLLSGCTATRCTGIAAFGNLGPDVNSPYDEYAPALPDTATLVFTSNRVEPGRGGLQEQYRAVRPAHLFLSMRLTNSWDAAQNYRLLFSDNGNGNGSGDAGTITFAPAGSSFNVTAYIGACEREASVGGCDLYAVTEGATSAIVNPGAGLNSAGWDGQPFITPDGRRLYFASDRPGGLGGSDIWIAERTAAGTWGEPYNAGAAVNTSGDEYSPFFDAGHSRLYFAAATPSNGLDIFKLDSGSTGRQVLSAPFNSPSDDFTPFLRDGLLYLASNRPGGCGGFDLYGFAVGE